MVAYVVTLPEVSGYTLEQGKDSVVVEAADVAQARTMAELASGVDAADWSNATATVIEAAADFQGWTFVVEVYEPTGGTLVHQASYVGVASDTLDLMAAGLEAALDARGLTAFYNSTTQALTVATGTGTDDLGDHVVYTGAFPPGSSVPPRLGAAQDGIDFVASITDAGVATADLTVTYVADGPAIPSTPVLLKS